MTTRLNIGCGAIYHPDWINLDIEPSTASVCQWDATQRLPCGDGVADVCYASHVVEHLSPVDAEGLLRQCYRVLKDRGIIRIVVPDLEAIAREYISVLARIDEGDVRAAADHEWIVIELLDQMVRVRSGGEMSRYLLSGSVPNETYIVSRIGADAENLMKRGSSSASSSIAMTRKGGKRMHDLLMKAGAPWTLLSRAAQYVREESAVLLCGTLLGQRGAQSVREALFRRSGECHRWMYDRVSLKRLFERSGFIGARVCTAYESQIEGFSAYGLDVTNGRIRKPDSLYMEAVKSCVID